MLVDTFFVNHVVMEFGVGVWHYICPSMVRSDDGLGGCSGCGVDAQCVIQGLLGRLGADGFSHVQGAPVGAPEGGGDSLASFEDLAKGVPACMLAGLVKAPADELYELAGDGGDEQMSFGADGLLVEDGAQSELGLQ